MSTTLTVFAATALLLLGVIVQAQECRTVATRNGTPRPERCVSPFFFKGRRRVGCITDDDPDNKPWCSVEVDSNGNHVAGKGRWGHCDRDTCPETNRPSSGPIPTTAKGISKSFCRTVGGNDKVAVGTECVFPFNFRGVTYNECILVGATDGVPWCSTQTNSNGEHKRGTWAHCDSSCSRRGVKTTTRRPTVTKTPISGSFVGDVSPGTHLPSLSSNDCQLTNGDSGFIVGGSDAKPFQFPFMALIGFRRTDRRNSEISYGCGGTLINNWYILSAAHCFSNPLNEAVNVLVGDVDLNRDRDCTTVAKQRRCAPPPQKLPIREVISHRSFRGKFPYHQDIALIRLSQPAQYNANVRPVCLPVSEREAFTILGLNSLENLDTSVALILGWGKTRIDDRGRPKVKGNAASSKLQFARVPFSSASDCSSTWRGVEEATQVCAGKEGVDSCNGDSGGPLLLFGSEGSMIQVGVVSFGSPNCGDGKPAVYTRVTAFMQWIKNNLKP